MKRIQHLKILIFITLYRAAETSLTFEETEQKQLEVIKLIDERLKQQWNDMEFIDLKQIIYYNLAIMYYRAAVDFKDERGPPSPDEKDAFNLLVEKLGSKGKAQEFCRQKAIEYMKKWLEYNKWMKENWNSFEFFAWRYDYEKDAENEGKTLKEFMEECKDSFKGGNQKREEELKTLQKYLE